MSSSTAETTSSGLTRVVTSRRTCVCDDSDVVSAWVIRSGRYGERDAWAIESSHSGGGWQEVPDLTHAASHDAVAALVRSAFPEATTGTLNTQVGQVWAMRSRIAVGDLMVMPMKTTQRIAFGIVSGGYHYLADEPDSTRRHVLDVEWKRQDVLRGAVKQDLLYTLGSALSVFSPSKNDAVRRLQAILDTGVDPGQSGLKQPGIPSSDEDAVDQPESDLDTAQVARDRITTRVNEEFKGHGLAELVGALLTAEGFTCTVSPPGPDQGIDIIAGTGPLGIDSPRVIVQVKSGGVIGNAVVNQLNGVINQHNADQGLLVAWDGLTGPGREALRNMQLRIALWESTDVINKLLALYDRLPEELKNRLPLQRVWMLAD